MYKNISNKQSENKNTLHMRNKLNKHQSVLTVSIYIYYSFN